ncbi:MAG: Tim44/TimA family putative adaptor protein [Rhodospirillales bacterium]
MSDGFQFIDIIFFAMIAAFLVLRLRSVLGRRDGHEGKFPDLFRSRTDNQSGDNVVPLPDRSGPPDGEVLATEPPLEADGDADPLTRGLALIKRTNPKFDTEEFLSGAQIAFELILGAYASGDTSTLKPLLSSEVFANFSQAIRAREQGGETIEDTLVGIKSAEIVEADVDNSTANITVKFVSEQINVTRDENGDVVDGNPNAVIDVTDFWTFARDTKSRDPNWTLVATSSLD